ncbi:hypothetical protein [Hymenobacter sp. DG01]|uniref:hypothetical protein n=1 Tax=Hymenobacter sp. DG01 TaxID=2584940 RepID=UPI00111D2400|nr:hypothetical protein [Hymenobacter sp. DG01]
MSKYKLEDINVGDEVYLRTKAFDSPDLYWKVIGKDEHGLFLNIDEMAVKDRCYVCIGDEHDHIQIPS